MVAMQDESRSSGGTLAVPKWVAGVLAGILSGVAVLAVSWVSSMILNDHDRIVILEERMNAHKNFKHPPKEYDIRIQRVEEAVKAQRGKLERAIDERRLHKN